MRRKLLIDPEPVEATEAALDTTALTLLAEGKERRVYQHPNNPDWLLKVMRPSKRNWLDTEGKLRRFRPSYPVFRREHANFVTTEGISDRLGRACPLAPLHGLEVTDQGFAQIVDRVRNAEGETAPTLQDMINSGGLNADHRGLLNAFCQDLFDFHVIAYDLGPKNIMLSMRNGAKFLLVDGYGERALIPLRRWSLGLNRWMLHKEVSGLAKVCGLRWNASKREIEE